MTENYHIKFSNNKEVDWSTELVKSKLTAIGKMSGKKIAWIRSDCSVHSSNSVTRFIWSLIAKRFSFLRKIFYKVDLEQSKKILNQIGRQIGEKQTDEEMKKLYDEAVAKFEAIAPGHSLRHCSEETETAKKTTDKQKKTSSIKPSTPTPAVKKEVKEPLKFTGSPSLTDEELTQLIEGKDIREMNLTGCKNITDKGIESLAEIEYLTVLDLSHCENITIDSLNHLGKMKCLHSLHLPSWKSISHQHLEQLMRFEKLSILFVHIDTVIPPDFELPQKNDLMSKMLLRHKKLLKMNSQ